MSCEWEEKHQHQQREQEKIKVKEKQKRIFERKKKAEERELEKKHRANERRAERKWKAKLWLTQMFEKERRTRSSKKLLMIVDFSLVRSPPVSELSGREHTNTTLLMVCLKNNGFNAQTLNFVESGCIAAASLEIKVDSISAISAISYLL